MRILPLPIGLSAVLVVTYGFAFSNEEEKREVVTDADVLAMMNAVPAKEDGADKRPGYPWSKAPDAPVIARAVAAAAPNRRKAARLVVYGIFESALHTDAVGDHGASLGVWQLSTKVVPREVALDPMRAAPVWLGFEAASRKTCWSSPPEIQLAALASGDCHGALTKVALRERVTLRALRAAEAARSPSP